MLLRFSSKLVVWRSKSDICIAVPSIILDSGLYTTDRKNEKRLSDLFSGKKPKEGLPANPYLDQFASHSAGDAWTTPWKIKKDGGNADYISGATLSSRAVTDLAWRAASAFRKHAAELLAPASGKESGK